VALKATNLPLRICEPSFNSVKTEHISSISLFSVYKTESMGKLSLFEVLYEMNVLI